jgi:peptidoglycan/LPS O-acetylase OafA/YrhL
MAAATSAEPRVDAGGILILPPGLFRLGLASAVVLSHVSRFDIGRLAVLLFFFLSGYWVSLIWRKKFGPGSTLRFYAARYLRIAPLYLLAMAVAALLRGTHVGPENFTLLGLASSDRDSTGVAWSLDIELQFYLLVPLIMAALLRAPLWASVVGMTLSSVIGYWLSARLGLVTVAIYLPAFALGALTYVRDWRPSARTSLVSLAAFLVMTAITAMTPFWEKSTPDPFDHDIWGFLWMLPLLPYVARSLHARSSKLDRTFGDLSYPLYLVHFTVISVAIANFGASLPVQATAVAVSAAIALAVFFFIDRPIDRWRVRTTEPGESVA